MQSKCKTGQTEKDMDVEMARVRKTHIKRSYRQATMEHA